MDFSAASMWVAMIGAIATIVSASLPALVKLAITWLVTRSKPEKEVLDSLPAILQAVDSPRLLARLVRRRSGDRPLRR